ncbi:MAG: tRNA dihydrouridine(20/20a) synthase DusA [Alphaproteobacteria bacterium]
MMDWTDRHDRFFLRLISRRARLYTEMVTADAVRHGDRARLLGFSPEEHPLALQLGGSEPAALAEAARVAEEFGYDEINLNVGCPSDRVQSGRFGACLMREPELVAECVAAMRAAVHVPVTVKCRIGVDDQAPEEVLPRFAEAVSAAGSEVLIVHARKAWLEGLSPRENRDVPPLDYPLVYGLKRDFPHLSVIINGGIETLDAAEEHLRFVDGVMLGRAAYRTPCVLAEADKRFFGDARPAPSRSEIVERFIPYAERQLEAGVPLHAMTRHMLGLYQGCPGARRWRQVLSTQAVKPGAGTAVLREALAAVEPAPVAAGAA